MTLDEIYTEWSTDSVIDNTAIDKESLKIPKLHNKYYRYFSNERLRFKKIEAEYKKLLIVKTEYYNGTLDKESLESKGWQPNRRIILKADIANYVDADDDVIELALKIEYQKEKLGLLESIIKNIHNRNYILRSHIDWIKFMSGA